MINYKQQYKDDLIVTIECTDGVNQYDSNLTNNKMFYAVGSKTSNDLSLVSRVRRIALWCVKPDAIINFKGGGTFRIFDDDGQITNINYDSLQNAQGTRLRQEINLKFTNNDSNIRFTNSNEHNLTRNINDLDDKSNVSEFNATVTVPSDVKCNYTTGTHKFINNQPVNILFDGNIKKGDTITIKRNGRSDINTTINFNTDLAFGYFHMSNVNNMEIIYKHIKEEVIGTTDGLNVGERNLLYKTKDMDTNNKNWYKKGSNTSYEKRQDKKAIHSWGDWSTYVSNQTIHFETNTDYVVSAYLLSYQEGNKGSNGSGIQFGVYAKNTADNQTFTFGVLQNTKGNLSNTEWKRFSTVYHNTTAKDITDFRIEASGDWSTVSGNIWISEIKLEKGNIATDWSPAPEDTDATQTKEETPKPEPKPEPKPTPKPEPKPEPKPAPKPEPKPEPKPTPKPEPKPKQYKLIPTLQNAKIIVPEATIDKYGKTVYYLDPKHTTITIKANDGYTFENNGTLTYKINSSTQGEYTIKATHTDTVTVTLPSDINWDYQGSFMLTMGAVKTEIVETTGGFTNIYKADYTNLLKFSNEVILKTVGGSSSNFQAYDVTPYINNLVLLPFNVPSGEKSNIVAGNEVFKTQLSTVDNNYLNVNLGNITVSETYKNGYDYYNVKTRLMLPYTNMIELDPVHVINKTISIKYIVNVVNGDTTINLSNEDDLFYSEQVNLSNEVPFISNARKGSQYAVINRLKTVFKNDINQAYIIIEQPTPILNSEYYPTNEKGTLKGYNGNVKVSLLNNMNINSNELNSLQNILKNGVNIK